MIMINLSYYVYNIYVLDKLLDNVKIWYVAYVNRKNYLYNKITYKFLKFIFKYFLILVNIYKLLKIKKLYLHN